MVMAVFGWVFGLGLVAMVGATYTNCPYEWYFDLRIQKCKRCSSCPIDEIIRRPCKGHRNTECGPFLEFNAFYQLPQNPRRKGHKHFNDVGRNNRSEEDQERRLYEPKAPERAVPTLGEETRQQHHRSRGEEEPYDEPTVKQPDLATVSKGENPWRTIALTLIGIICILTIFLVAFVIFIYYIRKHRSAMSKQIIYDTDTCLTEVCYSTMALDFMEKPFQRECEYKKPVPNLLLPPRVTQHGASAAAEIAEESEDSGGCPLDHSTRRCVQYAPDNLEYDADGSGQTVSSLNTASTDYVYFKPSHIDRVVP